MATCEAVPPNWKLGKPMPIEAGVPAQDPPPELRPGESGTYFTASGVNGSTFWSQEGIALIRHGCVVWKQILTFADGTVVQPARP